MLVGVLPLFPCEVTSLPAAGATGDNAAPPPPPPHAHSALNIAQDNTKPSLLERMPRQPCKTTTGDGDAQPSHIEELERTTAWAQEPTGVVTEKNRVSGVRDTSCIGVPSRAVYMELTLVIQDNLGRRSLAYGLRAWR
jgi:hypothetical protein